MNELPRGTVTFLFTDIEGSTKLWQQFPDAMPTALARHHEILQRAIEAHNGYVFQIIGDAFCAAFATAFDGLDAALDAQRALRDELWGETRAIRVRMALHTGAAEVRAGEFTSGEYVSGYTLSRAARLLSAGHGGQILLSSPATELVREQLPQNTALRDMGAHRLKDLVQPQQIFQILAPDLLQEFPALKTLDALPNNLPIQLASFIGREKEIKEISEMLAASAGVESHSVIRLLTLTGAGGSGKTRLSLQVAAEVIDEFEKGAWFVDLSPISDPTLVPNAVMSALELREVAGRAPRDALTDYLRAKNLLLILDNCEHLIEACAQLAHHLLTHCPQLKILATSREGLGVAGEVTYQVPVLGLPDPKHLPSLETLSQYDAVKLFVERALAVQPNFSIMNANAPAVAQICYRLDGIPLALELAAARIKLFSPEQIAARLDDRFHLLTGGSRTAVPRQQTLRAAIEWSYSLLSRQERILFRRLAVFVGGWTFEAAEQVCAGDGVDALDVLELLSHLVDKSLVVTEAQEQETRYRMLETIREYAFEKLRDSDETETFRACHQRFFLALAQKLGTPLSNQVASYFNRLEQEHDNLHAALNRMFEQNEIEQALEMCVALADFWSMRGYWTESGVWFQRALAAGQQEPTLTLSSVYHALLARVLLEEGHRAVVQGDYQTARVRLEESRVLYRELDDEKGLAGVCFSQGGLAWYQGDSETAHSLYEQALELARKSNDDSRIANALWILGILARERGDYSAARALSEESLVRYRELDDRAMMAWALENLGCVAMLQGDYDQSNTLFEESMALHQEVDDKMGLAALLMNRGFLAWYQSDYREARSWLEQSLRLFQSLGFAAFIIAPCVTGVAAVDAVEGHHKRAAKLLGAGEAMLATTERHLTDIYLDVHNRTVATIRAQLTEAEFKSAWEQGSALTMEQAIELAMRED